MFDIVTRREFVGAAFRIFRKPLVLAGFSAVVLFLLFREFTLTEWQMLGAIAALLFVAVFVRWLAARIKSSLSDKVKEVSDTIGVIATAAACFIAGAVAWQQFQSGDRMASFYIATVTLIAVIGGVIEHYKNKAKAASADEDRAEAEGVMSTDA